ncbi:putative phosphothreonine lyase domain-containg protein [Halorubrum sp. LN27]|uniref:putative phosphothreonine lyase domain-containing protein n=1 Tax=Halorubrum sp. LN27 TaxID=2801032 RepID=UPI00190D27A1|nr:putative phosphothreonine lyase domain-containg protein [Halorubrum sp. LN27]
MPSDIDQLTTLACRRTSAAEEDIRDDIRQLKQYGVGDEAILKTVSIKYNNTETISLLDVPSVTFPRAGLLVENGIEDVRSLAAADPSSVANADIGSKSMAESIIEGAKIILNDSDVLDRLQNETDISDTQLVKHLRSLISDGIPPSDVVDELIKILNQEPSLLEACGLDMKQAHYLRQEGFETVEQIADSNVVNIVEARSIGTKTAQLVIEAAQRELGRTKSGQRNLESQDSNGKSGESSPNSQSTDSQTKSSDRSERQNTSELKDNPSTVSNPSTNSDDTELRLLLIGSARPNIQDGEVAGIRIRAVLETEGYDLSSFDAAIYSGFTPPSPHHEQLGPQSCFEELIDQLGPLASKLPVYFITGDFGHGDPLDTVYDEFEYAPGSTSDPFVTAPNEELRYIPTQETVSLKHLSLTQNPAIAASEDNCVIVTPDLYPELWNNHDSLAYIAGGQLPGRTVNNSIAPMYSMENVGPMRPDAAGGIHDVTLTDDGINSHNLISFDDAGLVTCPDHIDRGLQFTDTGDRCIFCHNEERYFEEWLITGARKARHDKRDFDLDGAVEFVADTAKLTSEQETQFREYVSERIYEDYFGIKDRGPTIDGRRTPDSPLIPDPRSVYDESSQQASKLLRVQPHERAKYFRRYNIEDVQETTNRPFDKVAPPIPEDMSEAHKELDRGAYERSELGGEWLVFPKRQTIGSVWQQALELVDEGVLYDAQVSTAWHHEARGDRSKRYYMGLAVPNYFDVADVYRVGNVITSEDLVGDEGMFFFKPLFYTRLGVARRNARDYGLDSSTRYTLSALNKLDISDRD